MDARPTGWMYRYLSEISQASIMNTWLHRGRSKIVEGLETQQPPGTKIKEMTVDDHLPAPKMGTPRTLSDRRFILKGRKMAVAKQTNSETVSKATLGTILPDGVQRIWTFASAYVYHLEWHEVIQ